MVMTFFPDSASIEALSATADVKGFDFDRATERLTDLSLLDVQQADLTSEPRYVLHPLVRSFAAAQLVEQADFEKAARERWAEWYIALSTHVGYCWDDLERLKHFDPEHETAAEVAVWTFNHMWYTHTLQLAQSHGLSYYYSTRGAWDRKIAIDRIFAKTARQMLNTEVELVNISLIAILLSEQGQIADAKVYVQQLTELLELNPNPGYAMFMAHRACGSYQMACREFAQAQRIFAQSANMARHVSIPFHISHRGWQAICLYCLGDSAQAQHLLREVMHDAQQSNYEPATVRFLPFLAVIALDQGNLTEAENILTRSLMKARDWAQDRYIVPIQQIQARLHILQGNIPAARIALTEAIDLSERQGRRRELAEAREELARIEAQMAASAE
jgi:tetratricopeptide (TPR) repeat protein